MSFSPPLKLKGNDDLEYFEKGKHWLMMVCFACGSSDAYSSPYVFYVVLAHHTQLRRAPAAGVPFTPSPLTLLHIEASSWRPVCRDFATQEVGQNFTHAPSHLIQVSVSRFHVSHLYSSIAHDLEMSSPFSSSVRFFPTLLDKRESWLDSAFS